MVVTPLYGHDSEATAYIILDYPYGRLRCQMKVWLETDPKKGTRFVSRTCNPKNGVWNKPKASTYSLLAGNLYVDEKGHVVWDGLSEYDDHDRVLAFVTSFPQNPQMRRLKVWTIKKVAYYRLLVTGEAGFTMNRVRQEPTPADIERYQTELAGWESILQMEPMKAIVDKKEQE